MRVRVKICGITSVADGLAAARCGADAIGLMFYPRSRRAIDLDTAAAIATALPPYVTTVGVFVDPTATRVEQILDRVQIDVLQFQGDESPGFCESFGKPFVKAIGMHPDIDVAAIADAFGRASALHLDTHDPVARGGTGRSFDWRLWPTDVDRPLILAGGLTPENVGEAIAATRPYAVDVSGGVEASKGVKDPAKIERFIEEVNRDGRK